MDEIPLGFLFLLFDNFLRFHTVMVQKLSEPI